MKWWKMGDRRSKSGKWVKFILAPSLITLVEMLCPIQKPRRNFTEGKEACIPSYQQLTTQRNDRRLKDREAKSNGKNEQLTF